MVPAIEDPAGDLVPDPRSPAFTVPAWVRMPGFLAPHLAARNSVTIAGLPGKVGAGPWVIGGVRFAGEEG